MNDKCPKCGAEKPTLGWYACGTCITDQEPSRFCRERAAHAETRKKLDEVEIKEIGAGYAAQHLRYLCGLDNSKEDLSEVAELVSSLRSDLTETRRKLGEWKGWAEALAESLEGIENDFEIPGLDSMMKQYRDFTKAEKGGAV